MAKSEPTPKKALLQGRVDAEMHRKFKGLCQYHGITGNDVLDELLRSFVESNGESVSWKRSHAKPK